MAAIYQWPGNYSSSVVDGSSGYMYTQEDYFGSDPNFEHPFYGESYDAWTMSGVFRFTGGLDTSRRSIFMLQHASTRLNMGMRIIGSPDEPYISCNLGSNDGASFNIVQGSIRMSTELAAWPENAEHDWIWAALSWSRSLDIVKMAVRHFATQQEYFKTIATETSARNLEWDNAVPTNVSSICSWGCGIPTGISPGLELWLGDISQVIMHNQYLNLSEAASRNKLCHLDGITNLGVNGEIPFGGQPLVYLPNGLPSGNKGSIHIGDYPADFYLEGAEVPGASPPRSAT